MDFSALATTITDPSTILMGFVGVLTFATIVTLASPSAGALDAREPG